MNDDQHRARKDHASKNFAVLKWIALSIIKANPAKGSNRGKFKKAGWNNDCLKNAHQSLFKRDYPACGGSLVASACKACLYYVKKHQ
jgi:hypothetical protein